MRACVARRCINTITMPSLNFDVLYHHLLPHCDSATLCEATQVCKDVSAKALRLLYSSVRLDCTARCAALVDTFEAKPTHGELVRDLILRGVDERDTLAELLGRVPGLERLDVTLSCEFPANGFAFRLRHLKIHDQSTTLDSSDFVAFLDEQDEIEVLELVGADSANRWPWLRACARDAYFGKMLPRMRALHAPMDMVLAFLENVRPELLEIMVQSDAAENADDAQALCAAIAVSAVNVRWLALGTRDAAETVRLVAGACKRLQTLELMVSYKGAFEKFVGESQVDAGEPISQKALKRFVLHVVHDEPLDPVDLQSALQTNVVPGLRQIFQGLDECKLVLH